MAYSIYVLVMMARLFIKKKNKVLTYIKGNVVIHVGVQAISKKQETCGRLHYRFQVMSLNIDWPL